MGVVDRAVEWAVAVAEDPTHGYDQASRWGTPDYDCSSFVISAYRHAGVPLTSTYTGNMRSDFLNHGFVIPINYNLATGEGLKRGDVLLNERSHTALCLGNGNDQFQIDEAVGGKTAFVQVHIYQHGVPPVSYGFQIPQYSRQRASQLSWRT